MKIKEKQTEIQDFRHSTLNVIEKSPAFWTLVQNGEFNILYFCFVFHVKKFLSHCCNFEKIFQRPFRFVSTFELNALKFWLLQDSWQTKGKNSVNGISAKKKGSCSNIFSNIWDQVGSKGETRFDYLKIPFYV